MRISRRALLGSGVAMAGANLASPALASGRKRLIMVTSWPRDLPGPGLTAKRIAQNIALATDDAISIKLFAAGELVGGLGVFDAVQSGVAQIGHTASLFWQGKIAIAALFTAAPFGLTPMEHMAWILQGGGQALWDRLYKPFNIKPLMGGNTGYQMGGWYKNPIQSVQDLKGLRIRMPGLGARVIAQLGASPITLSPGEILPALQTGVIDATEFLGPWSDRALGFHKVAKNYYWPGFHEPNGSSECLFSLEAWNELSQSHRAAIQAVIAQENAHSLTESQWQNAVSLKRLVEHDGVVLHKFPDDVLKAARPASENVLSELAKAGALEAETIQSYRAARALLSDWQSVSVAPFIAAR